MTAGTFVIVQKSNDSFQFSLRAANGRAILISPEFSNKKGCDKGIDAVRQNAMNDTHYEMLAAPTGDFYFNLKTQSGIIIGSSTMYKNRIACHQDILAVKEYAQEAVIDSYYAEDHSTYQAYR